MVYLDNAASTRVSEAVLTAMTDVMRTAWGNPSSQHPQGAAARGHIAQARSRLLAALGDSDGPSRLGEVIWTSGCTEADALAVLGAARVKPGAVITTTIEHAAISSLVARLGEQRAAQIAPGAGCLIEPAAVARAAETASVVSIVMVQNEIGAVQPVAEIFRAVRRVNPSCHLHVDAAQAFGKLPIDVRELDADSIAIAGHKLHGPKGIGALWLRTGCPLEPLWVGGGQQGGLRGGTQDAPSATGLGLAAEQAVTALADSRARWLGFAARVMQVLAERGVAARQLVPDEHRSPHILAIGIAGVPAGAMRTVLASRGVYISTGSACAERDGRDKPSPVLVAIGLPQDSGMCRLSFGLDTTADDVEVGARTLADVAIELAARR